MKKLYLIKEYLKYFFKAKGAHGTHSPFIFSFINEVLKDTRDFYAFQEIEHIREVLLDNHQEIQIQDFGAGSLHNNSNTRKISEIAKNAGRSKKHGELLFRIANYFELNQILELGTSLGLATSYLAKAKENAKVVTIEGDEKIATVAHDNFKQLNLNNISQHVGNFDNVLEETIKKYNTFDLIFIDGNHQQEPTERYYDICKQYVHRNSLIIFDDIHWSPGMTAAWNKIKRDPQVKVSIDLFQFGLVFFMEEVKEKQDFILRY